jgi:hypothetical protein
MGEKKQVFKWIANVPTESQESVTAYVEEELHKIMKTLN